MTIGNSTGNKLKGEQLAEAGLGTTVAEKPEATVDEKNTKTSN